MFEKMHPRYHVRHAQCHDLMVYLLFDSEKYHLSEFLIFLDDKFPIGFKNTRIICFDFPDSETIELLTDKPGKEHWLFSKVTRKYIQILPKNANIFSHGIAEILEKNNHDEEVESKLYT